MRLKRIFVALLAVTALAAVAAGGAQAAAEWKIAGASFTGNKTVSLERHSTVPLTFHSELLGLKVTVTASGISCATTTGCTITGGGVSSAGTLKFTGATVDINEAASPKCAVNGGTVETKPLVDEVIMHPTLKVGETDEENTKLPVADKFKPASGTAFATLTFSGAECPLNETSASVTGTACGEAVTTEPAGTFKSLSTGQEKAVQTLLFGEAQQKTFGCELKLGTKVAQLTGAVDNKLSETAELGKVFGVS